MRTVPDVDEVLEVASRLGMRLRPDEARLYCDLLVEELTQLHDFVQSRDFVETRPPLHAPAREPGYRPSPDEDPYNAWLWRFHLTDRDGGPLAGKTVSYKDTMCVAGYPLTFGAFDMEGFIAEVDATIVTRVLEAGGTIIGKNTCGGFVADPGSGWQDSGDYHPARNPHDPDRAPGGSSSGGAVAVATGQVDIAFGGDQGGSIRLPAAWCGTLGLMPTFGLVSHFGVAFGADQSIDFVGPLARNVDDLALALEAVAGPDGLDPRQGRDVPERIDVRSVVDGGVDGLRVGVVHEGFHGVEEDVDATVRAATDVLADLGADVVPVSVPEHRLAARAYGALRSEGAHAVLQSGIGGSWAKTYYPPTLTAAVNHLWTHRLDVIAPRTKLQYLTAELSRRRYAGRVYAKAQNVRPTITAGYNRALAEVDVLAMPTCPTKPVPVYRPDSELAGIEREVRAARVRTVNTTPFNYTGHPALAVPCQKSQGLPVSMQLVGRHFDDALLLRVARAYEQAVDWAQIIGVAA